MKALVAIERCIGCEFCASTCPRVFSMNEVGPDIEQSVPIEGEIPDDVLDLALDVESKCPVNAIIIED